VKVILPPEDVITIGVEDEVGIGGEIDNIVLLFNALDITSTSEVPKPPSEPVALKKYVVSVPVDVFTAATAPEGEVRSPNIMGGIGVPRLVALAVHVLCN
jgi:hypothetical protein